MCSTPGLFKNPLHFIPPSIADLSKLVILTKPESSHTPSRKARTFTRAATVPASDTLFWAGSTGHGTTALGKAASFAGLQAPAEPLLNEIKIYLENNAIRVLPLELFSLTSLTVLNLCEQIFLLFIGSIIILIPWIHTRWQPSRLHSSSDRTAQESA